MTTTGQYLWLFKIRVTRREERTVRIMAETQREAHRQLKREFPSCHIIEERRPTMTLYPTPESGN